MNVLPCPAQLEHEFDHQQCLFVVVVVVLWNLFVYLFKRITEIEKNKNKTSTLWYIPQMLASAGAGLRQTKPRSQEFQQVSHMGTEAQVLLLSPGP